jgi:hypothetical protein
MPPDFAIEFCLVTAWLSPRNCVSTNEKYWKNAFHAVQTDMAKQSLISNGLRLKST